MGKERIQLGNLGEKLAVNFLIQKGCRIIDRNYRCCLGEIDIIAKDEDFIVFVEVKTVRANSFFLPQESITRKKQIKLCKLALSYLKHFNLCSAKARFDVICVWKENNGFSEAKIELFKDAFSLTSSFSP